MNIHTGFPSAIGLNVSGHLNKVFPNVSPEGYALPYATYIQTYSDPTKCLDGYAGEKTVEYRFDFYAETYLAAKTAGAEWVEYIKNFSGVLGSMGVQDVEIVTEADSSSFVGSKIRYNSIVIARFVCITSDSPGRGGYNPPLQIPSIYNYRCVLTAYGFVVAGSLISTDSDSTNLTKVGDTISLGLNASQFNNGVLVSLDGAILNNGVDVVYVSEYVLALPTYDLYSGDRIQVLK